MAEREATPGAKPDRKGRLVSPRHISGSHEHDREGGFAADPSLARTAGRLGGERVKENLRLQLLHGDWPQGRRSGSRYARHRVLPRIGKLGREARSRRQREEASE